MAIINPANLKMSPIHEIPKMIVYRRPLHPEMFKLRARRLDRHNGYEAESWIVDGGHVLRFQFGQVNMVEVCMENCDHLPESGMLHALPCIGERDYEHAPIGGVGYITSLQTENLSENLYAATYREMCEFAQEAEAIHWLWETPQGRNLSVVDVQKYRSEYHIQTYHLTAKGGNVLRTQTVFELVK